MTLGNVVRKMSTGTPIPSLSFRDTLTRVIPGSVVVSAPIVVAMFTAPHLLPSEPIHYIVLALISYLIGEIIDQIRSGLFRVPNRFRWFIYDHTRDIQDIPRWYRNRVKYQNYLPDIFHIDIDDELEMQGTVSYELDLDFHEDMESELGVDFDHNSPRDIYDMLLIYMDPHFTRRIRRQQSLAIFASNFRLSALGATLVYLYYAIVNIGSLISYISIGMVVLIIIILLSGWSVLNMTQHQYGELLMKEYYAERHSRVSEG